MTALRSPASAISRLVAFPKPTPWTCRQCLSNTPIHDRLRAFHQRPAFSTSQYVAAAAGKRAWRQRIHIPKERRKVALAVTALFLTGAGALAFSENARYTYFAIERCGRVGVTLFLCIRDYHNTLKKEDWNDPRFQADMSACHKRCAERTLSAMEKNGSIFIKLGQHLSSLNYLLPDEWCDTFIPLQDKCPVSSFTSINEMVKHDTGKSLDEYFTTFEARPIGAASLAQVHVATLKSTGEKVAVKVQHPSLDEYSKLDMWLTRKTFETVKYWFPEYDLTWLSDEMSASLPAELDFREEARNAIRTKEYFSHIPNTPLVIPTVVWAERRLLVMEYITGHRPDDLAFLDSHGISRDEVSAALARIFNEMIFGTDAPLHCDPHGGNLAIRLHDPTRRGDPRNFDVVLYDHGLYRDIPLAIRRAYAHLWLAVLATDIPQMRRYAYEIAGIGDAEFPIFASAITGRDFGVITSAAESSPDRPAGSPGAGVVSERRSPDEKRSLSQSLGEDLVEKLCALLARVPRVILLILKTNDLTRSLDENLHTSQGPVRSFLILARYAAHCVFEEELEAVRGSWLWPRNWYRVGAAAWMYANVAIKLRLYEYWLSARRRMGYGGKGAEGLGLIETLV